VAVKGSGGEVFDALAKNCVRSSHYAKSGFLEAAVKEASAGKE
jgi:hypothetical protein